MLLLFGNINTCSPLTLSIDVIISCVLGFIVCPPDINSSTIRSLNNSFTPWPIPIDMKLYFLYSFFLFLFLALNCSFIFSILILVNYHVLMPYLIYDLDYLYVYV